MPKPSYICSIHMCIFNFFEVQIIPPMNKKYIQLKIFVKPL